MHPNLQKIIKIHDLKTNGRNIETFWKNTQKHPLTISVIISNFNKIFGLYCPKKWEFSKNKLQEVTEGDCFIYYFDDE